MLGNLFTRFARGMAKTRAGLGRRLHDLFAGRAAIDEDLYSELEDVLIQADVGVPTTTKLVDALRRNVERLKIKEPAGVQDLLIAEIRNMLEQAAKPLAPLKQGELRTFMVVGVNGAGKTTTIGKLAAKFHQEGWKVLVAAGDTFRAAAVEQLETWTKRAEVQLISHQEGSDPASVAFDAAQAARARRVDALIIDTAGRLQNKAHLMQELSKVYRVTARELGREIDEVLLVLDANTGQNALSQARLFAEAVPLSGVVLTKLDGTAKGGIVLAISDELHLPVKLVTVGESLADLQEFQPEQFVNALFTEENSEV